MKKELKYKRVISWIVTLSLLTANLYGCGKPAANTEEPVVDNQVIDTSAIADAITEQIKFETAGNGVVSGESIVSNNVDKGTDTDQFVYNKIYDEYAVAYDTFDAVVRLSDGTELYGIGYSDFSCYFESDDGSKGFFPAGFLVAGGEYSIPEIEAENGIEIENLSYTDDAYGFVLAYDTETYYEHCVKNGKYIKYGIDEDGILKYVEEEYSKDSFDKNLGALYSYDEERYIYDPEEGEYISVNGNSIYSQIDYDEIESEVNRLLTEQDENFADVDIDTVVSFAKNAVNSYLLSLQEETFLGCDVNELVEEVSKLETSQCIRITPEGNVIVNVGDSIPNGPSAIAKWTVGIGCGILVAGSIALGVFVPAATPASGAICGAAIDVFMQVVVENNSIENINWSKVAVSATAGALMSWACPLGAGAITQSVAANTGNAVLSKLAGYGFLTFSNALVSGTTNAAFAIIDKKGESEVFDSFLIGAALGACCTVGAATLGEVGQAGMKALRNSNPQNWFVKLSDGAAKFIGGHQVHLKNAQLENILAPKSIYEATQAGLKEYNTQRTAYLGDLANSNTVADYSQGGTYKKVVEANKGTGNHAHEIPSFDSVEKASKGVSNITRDSADLPAVKMSPADHRQTASYGNSYEAKAYRELESKLIEQGRYKEAIQMGIDDLRSKFGTKYEKGIEKLIEAAIQKGWW